MHAQLMEQNRDVDTRMHARTPEANGVGGPSSGESAGAAALTSARLLSAVPAPLRALESTT